MITFSTINEKIQETLFDRMSMLDRDSTISDIGVATNYPIGETIATSGGDTRQNYMFARSVFMRMISMTPPVRADQSTAKPIVLMGGEAILKDGQYGIAHNFAGSKEFTKHTGREEENMEWKQYEGPLPSPMPETETQRNIMAGGEYGSIVGHEILEPSVTITPSWTETSVNPGKYWTEGETQPYRPMPGVKDISVEYVGGSLKLGATREATINWTCWTWSDLDRMMAHFLHHGKTIFIDWGWSGVGELKDVSLYDFFDENGDFLKENENGPIDHIGDVQKHVVAQKGNYDAMIGIVKNFEWTVREDGGFDCVTNIISPGISILQQSLKTSTDATLNALPTLFKEKITKEGAKGTRGNRKIFDYELAFQVEGEEETVQVSYTPAEKKTVDFSMMGDFNKDKSVSVNAVISKSAVKEYAPYINFDIYLDDLDQQLFGDGAPDNFNQGVLDNEKVMKGGHIIFLNKKYQINRDFTTAWLGSEKNEPTDKWVKGKFVTWGWFEDNVLSRFFSRVVASGTGIIGAIRSIENISEGLTTESGEQLDFSGEYDTKGPKTMLLYRAKPELSPANNDGIVASVEDRTAAWNDLRDNKSKTRRSVLIRNHPDMMTTDISKFLIVNESSKRNIKDPGRKLIEDSWGEWEQRDPGESESGVGRWWPTGKDTQTGKLMTNGVNKGHWSTNAGSHLYNPYLEGTEKKIKIHNFNSDENATSGELRKVYFNVNYLKEKMKGQKSIEKAILNVWEGFSQEYGGIYNFKLDFSDDGNRIMVKDDGWTQNTVKGLLENPSYRANPDAAEEDDDKVDKFDGLFIFPTWEKSSFVKSQNLTAKLPNRMQMAAMYGSQNSTSDEDTKKQEKVQAWDDRKSLAWGQLTAPLNEQLETSLNLTREQYSLKVRDDVVSGKYKFPYMRNMKFGQTQADPTKPLWTPPGPNPDNPDDEGVHEDGVIIQESIVDNLMKHHYSLYMDKQLIIANQLKADAEEAATTETAETDAKKIQDKIDAKEGTFIAIMAGTGDGESDPMNLYTFMSDDKSNPLVLDPLFKRFMITSIKGGKNSIVAKHDPIIPVEFEVEVDGVSGIYPGNAFQSSYLPTRYKQMACFQAMGVSQQVDSSGWTSTIKGQIRVSIENQIDEDKIGEEEKFKETKDFPPTPSPGNPNLPFPINLDLDILGELNTDGFDLDLEVGASYENTDEEPPPYVSSGVGEDMELRRTDEWDPSDLPAGYVGGGPNLDADFSNIDVDTPPPPLGDLSGNPFPDYQVPIGTPQTMADFGLSINSPSIAELPSQPGFVLESQSWIPNALLQTVENYISDTLSISPPIISSDGQSMVIMISEFGQSSGTISEAMVGLTNTISTFANNHELTTSLTNQIIGLMDDPNNPGVQIYFELTQGGD